VGYWLSQRGVAPALLEPLCILGFSSAVPCYAFDASASGRADESGWRGQRGPAGRRPRAQSARALPLRRFYVPRARNPFR